MEGPVILLKMNHWQTVTKFLTIRELGRLMCVSREWFRLWVDDSLWLYQEKRICAQFPGLKSLFDNCRTSKEAKKRHKTEWSMPRKGTWWVFKNSLYKGCYMDGIKELCRKTELHPIVLEVTRLVIPCPHLITVSKVVKPDKKTYTNHPMYHIYHWSKGINQDHCNRTTFTIRQGNDYFDCEFYFSHTGGTFDETNFGIHYAESDLFTAWRAILFQKHYQPCWTPLFSQLMQNQVI